MVNVFEGQASHFPKRRGDAIVIKNIYAHVVNKALCLRTH